MKRSTQEGPLPRWKRAVVSLLGLSMFGAGLYGFVQGNELALTASLVGVSLFRNPEGSMPYAVELVQTFVERRRAPP